MEKRPDQQDNDKEKDQSAGKASKKKKGGSALLAASVARSATAQAHHHTKAGGFASTGTNVSYEGATAPGAGGSVGTGYASGQEATGTTIHTNSDYEENRGGSPSKAKKNKAEENPDDENLHEYDDEDSD